MALLRLLHDLATQQHWPLQLTAAHCNHGVRSDAAESAAHVAAAAAALGLPFVQATAAARTQAGHWPEVRLGKAGCGRCAHSLSFRASCGRLQEARTPLRWVAAN
jgi:tRNA(Ile)-lysidine synthase TilS/MesJ